MNRIRKFFNIQTCNCLYCDKKKEIVNVYIYSDLDSVSVPNKVFKSIEICQSCLFKLGKNEMIMISLYSLTRNSVFKLLDAVDLSEGGKTSLKEMQNVLKKERECRIKSFNV